jgi:hypothetical protein
VGTVEDLDRLLSGADPDSSSWADGGGQESAAECLLRLSPEDWSALSELVGRRNAPWKRCLAETLTPKLGAVARRLLLELARDAELETSFSAMLAVAFHCGVDDGPDGPILEPSNQDAALIRDAREASGLTDAVWRLKRECDPRFQQRLALLVGVLET